jgi:hypothetical protein
MKDFVPTSQRRPFAQSRLLPLYRNMNIPLEDWIIINHYNLTCSDLDRPSRQLPANGWTRKMDSTLHGRSSRSRSTWLYQRLYWRLSSYIILAPLFAHPSFLLESLLVDRIRLIAQKEQPARHVRLPPCTCLESGSYLSTHPCCANRRDFDPLGVLAYGYACR